MVLAFVLLSPGGPPPTGPGSSPAPGSGSGSGSGSGPVPPRLLYARSFGPPPRGRLVRREQLLVVGRQVSSHHHLQQPSSSGRPPALTPPDDPWSLLSALGGLFQLPPGDPFPGPVTVSWLSVPGAAFALLCEPHENLVLAEVTLRIAADRLLPLLRPPGPGVLLRPDAVNVVLDRLVPHGQLLFLSHRFLRDVERERANRAAP